MSAISHTLSNRYLNRDRTVLIDGIGGRRVLRTPAELAAFDRPAVTVAELERRSRRRQYCMRERPDCGTCTLRLGPLDCAGVPWEVGAELIDRRDAFDQERNRAAFGGGAA